jgi:predicted transposase YdaD
MVYKFATLSQAEVRAMLGLNLTEEPRAIREAKEEGREEATLNLVIRQLMKRFGELPENLRSTISGLSLSALESLSEALLDFTNLDDLQAWLAAQE